MRILHAEVALLFACAACMGCSNPQATDEEIERSVPDDVPVPEGWTPIQLGLLPGGAQMFGSMYNVHGVRLNLLSSRSWIVNGLDLGLGVNFSYGAHGIQIGGFGNGIGSKGSGLQVAGLVNPVGQGRAGDGYSGLQVAGWANAGSADGIQLGGLSNGFFWRQEGVHHTHWQHGLNIFGHIRGLQAAGGINVAKQVAGVQVSGVANVAFEGFTGLQVGAINVAKSRADVGDRGRPTCSGVQVGVINVIDGGSGIQLGLWNSNPDGFLPYFPIFNFSF